MKDSNAIVCHKCFEMDTTHQKDSEVLVNSIVPECWNKWEEEK